MKYEPASPTELSPDDFSYVVAIFKQFSGMSEGRPRELFQGVYESLNALRDGKDIEPRRIPRREYKALIETTEGIVSLVHNLSLGMPDDVERNIKAYLVGAIELAYQPEE